MQPLIHPGPWLLRPDGSSLAAHRARYGRRPALSASQLIGLIEAAGVLGRGGAGFPFAVKLKATLGRRSLRRHLAVNLSEGEPASAKDGALTLTAPHLILDGAAATAQVLSTRTVHLVVPRERPWVERLLREALRERRSAGEDPKLSWQIHHAAPRFVSGEASAVTELIEGRENLPVTSWVPTAVRGIKGQPTMLSNAETLAQIAALILAPTAVPGPAEEPGSRLLSITRPDGVHVVEAIHGTPWSSVLTDEELDQPVLLGGYHGVWVPAGGLRELTVTAGLRDLGYNLGAGIVIPLDPAVCPLRRTGEVLGYLASQSAGRCGPCFHGLPALSEAFNDTVRGFDSAPVATLAGLVERRGACSHPDGTARLAKSALTTFADDVAAHAQGHCLFDQNALLRSSR